jgi:hypothetical protein
VRPDIGDIESKKNKQNSTLVVYPQAVAVTSVTLLRIRDVLSWIPDADPNIFPSRILDPDSNMFHPGSYIKGK